jgi:hypothetical protein
MKREIDEGCVRAEEAERKLHAAERKRFEFRV